MDTSNLTSTQPTAHKARSGSHAGQGASQSTNTAVHQSSSSNRSAEVAVDPKASSPSLVQDTLRKLNDLAQTSVAFTQHEETGRTVITVSDKTTGEKIRTIPSEDFLAIAAHLQETLDSADGLKPGLLVSSQA